MPEERRNLNTQIFIMQNAKAIIIVIVVLLLLEACATRPPVVVVCELPDDRLIRPLEFCQPADDLGSLEDCLVEFVHSVLPADNAKKVELLRQLETLKQRRE